MDRRDAAEMKCMMGKQMYRGKGKGLQFEGQVLRSGGKGQKLWMDVAPLGICLQLSELYMPRIKDSKQRDGMVAMVDELKGIVGGG